MSEETSATCKAVAEEEEVDETFTEPISARLVHDASVAGHTLHDVEDRLKSALKETRTHVQCLLETICKISEGLRVSDGLLKQGDVRIHRHNGHVEGVYDAGALQQLYKMIPPILVSHVRACKRAITEGEATEATLKSMGLMSECLNALLHLPISVEAREEVLLRIQRDDQFRAAVEAARSVDDEDVFSAFLRSMVGVADTTADASPESMS